MGKNSWAIQDVESYFPRLERRHHGNNFLDAINKKVCCNGSGGLLDKRRNWVKCHISPVWSTLMTDSWNNCCKGVEFAFVIWQLHQWWIRNITKILDFDRVVDNVDTGLKMNLPLLYCYFATWFVIWEISSDLLMPGFSSRVREAVWSGIKIWVPWHTHTVWN